VNALDWICLALAALAVVAGYRLGFVRRVAGWAGLIGGIALASALLPWILDTTDPESTPSRFLVGAGVLFAGAMVGQALGNLVGARLHRFVARGNLGTTDSALGAIAGVVGLLLALWLILPTMADVPGWPARQARTSQVARAIDRTLGSPPGVFDNLSRSLGVEGLPRVFDSLRPAPEVQPPPATSPVTGAALANAEASTVKVVGPACDKLQSGSGWVVRPGLVVTNAHVVAGTDSVQVSTFDERKYFGQVVAFDARHDLALISAPKLPAAPLAVAGAAEGDVGVALGYPGGGGLAVQPYRVSRLIDADGRDIYDSQAVERELLVLGADLHPGDSGGPLIDPQGRVAGVTFAIAPDQSSVAYAINVDEVQAILGSGTSAPVPVGPCIS
jgi:S1-C subfamily serine protease